MWGGGWINAWRVSGGGNAGMEGGRTNAFVHHVHLEREVLAVDAVLRGSVDVELGEAELVATEGGGAVYDDFDGGVEVLEFNGLLGDVEDGLLCGEAHGAVWMCVSEEDGPELYLRTDVDGRLVLASLAGLVLRCEGSPVERTKGVFVAKLGDLDFAFFTPVEAVEAGSGRRAGNKK